MCFRPAEAVANVEPIDCPDCGETSFPTDGILPSKCPYCGRSFAGEGVAPAPVAPKAPDAPSAPEAPKAPSAPKTLGK